VNADDDAPRRTQEQRRAEAERRLLDAAAELIGEVGPSGVTLATIGERAGYSRGLATHHFGTKAALMQRLVETVTEQFRDAAIIENTAGSVMDELLGVVRTYFGIVEDFQPTYRARLVLMADAIATPSADTRPAMVAADRLFREELAKGLGRGMATGELPSSIDADGLATVVVGMLRGVAFQSMVDDDVDLEAARLEIEQLLVARLQHPPTPTRAIRRRKTT